LIRRTVEHELPATLLVFPRLGSLTAKFSALVRDAAHETSGERRQTYTSGDFYGLRDYRSGDSRRHIHWRTSARRGKLMVRQFERAVHHDVAVYVDLWQPAPTTDEDREHVERAVSFAATLVHDLCRRDGCRVWLAIAGEAASPLEGAASTWLAREAMVRLTCAEPSVRNFDRDAWTSALAQAPRQATCVLVTSRKEAPAVADVARFASAPGQRSSAERLVCVCTQDVAFNEVFQIDAPVV